MNGHEPTISDVLEAVKASASASEGRMESRMEVKISEVLEAVKASASASESRMEIKISEVLEAVNNFSTTIEKRIDRIERNMMTKDEFGKFRSEMIDAIAREGSKVHGECVTLIRKEDERVTTLVGTLHEKDILDEGDVRLLEKLSPLAPI